MSECSSSSSSSTHTSQRNGKRKPPKGAPHVLKAEESFHHEELLRNAERALIHAGGSEFRQFCFELVESKWFSGAILGVIFVNTIFIGMQTSEYVVAKSEWYLNLVDQFFLSAYIMELVLKLYVWRVNFFKISWNVFDFVIVVASLIDFIIPLIVQNIGAFDARVFSVLRVFRAIRALRALRVIRTIRFLKNLQIIVSTVLQSIPAMGSIVMLISLVLYIFAIIGRGLYGEVDPDRFGNLAQACFTLFQLMTLDDWFYMYSDVRDRHPGHQHILIYLLLFIILETFIFINLFVAVIVDNLARTQAAANAIKPKSSPKEEVHAEHDSDTEMRVGGVHHRKRRRVTMFGLQTHTAEHYFPNLSPKECELRGRYLMLINSLEHHMHTARSHQRTLDELVDLVDFSKT